MEDMLVYGATKEEHNTHLRIVLERLEKARVMLNSAKCSFCQPMQGAFPIGHMRHFLGMANQLGKFSPKSPEL